MSMKYGLPIQIQEIKAVGDDWIVEGYASTFGNVDYGFDVVMPGAFDNTLADGHKISFLHSHDPRLVLGLPKKLKQDKKGLFGSFKISKTTLGADTRELLMDEAMGGFSIGYSTKESNITEGGVRQLLEVELYEVSLVSMPMNPQAIITNVKDYLASIGVAGDITLAEKAHALSDGLEQLLSDTRQLVSGADRPLSNTKRQELTELLEMFSGLDAVRSDLQSVLTAAPLSRVGGASVVSGKRTLYELSERRSRLAHILTE
jgi:HK97 family phage prohead protease